MNPERWEQIKTIYHSALEQEPARRDEFLDQACAGDPSLLEEVRSLLAQKSAGEDIFASPAMDAAARGLAEEKAAEPLPNLVGRSVLHYRIVEKIGEGGMGVVYRARDEHLKRDVAIKVLPPELVADPERRRRFVQEARAASALSHPNIVTIHDIASEGGRDFIVMEHVAGKTLDRKIGRKGMKLNDALKCAIQIADALAAAHTARIVHRDLKPANILVTESGHVKVLDFGLAKLTQPISDGEPDGTSSTALPTEEGRIMGTAAYMSPEQAQGKPVDTRSDIFSFGSVLYEMVTGHRAFQGDSGLSTLSAILSREPAPMSEEIPQEFEKLVAHCLRKDPTRRFQHMGDVKIALEDLKEESDSGELNKAVAQSQRARRRLALWASTAVLVILATMTVFVYLRQASREVPPVRVIPLTSSRGLQLSPSFSPDGSRVAFSWNGGKEDNYDIYIKPIGPGPARRLTSDPAGDYSPHWSPDGNWIAFYRGGSTYLVSPEGGSERKLVKGMASSWTPDGKFLAVYRRESDTKPCVIYLVSVETGEKTSPLTSPSTQSRGDMRPVVSPNGRNLAFVRYPERAEGFPEVYILPLSNSQPAGEPWRLTNDGAITVGGLTWTPDGRAIVYSSTRAGRPSLWRIAVSEGAQAERIPGTDDGSSPGISRGSPSRLVYARMYDNMSVWRRRTARGGNAAGIPERVIASMGREMDPQFSPDGNRIAFRSNRSGFPEIMICDSDGSNPVQLTSFKGSRTAGQPHWSPDGRMIAFDSEWPAGIDVFIINAEGGAPRRMTEGRWSELRPSWSRDGRWVYFGSNRSGTQQVWKSTAKGEDARQVTRDGGYEALETLDGKTLFYTKGDYFSPGLWSMPVEGGKEVGLPQLPSVRPGHWAIADRGIYFIDLDGVRSGEPVPVRLFDLQTRQLSKAGAVEKIGSFPFGSFSVTRDGVWILWRQVDRLESNLMLIENFR
jgi:eukaryotic-like serine/threonine-protein kinase